MNIGTQRVLENLSQSDIVPISDASSNVNRYILDYENGLISLDELNELVTDTVHLHKIDKEMYAIEVYREIVEVYGYLATLKNVAAFV